MALARNMASTLGTNAMICEMCHGKGSILPCPECNGSGVSYCCDTAGSYIDPAFPERACDYCGKLYRGPAVYCSLECATDDL
jgi:RecJ-like exonuclease